MRRRIKLYVSAGPDLERERDVIGRAVAELPLAAGWEIGRTPRPGPAGLDASVPVAPHDCDFFIFILGQDITAPAGSEWDQAQAARRPMLTLLKDVARTPAGLEFQRFREGNWVRFKSPEALQREVQGWLLRSLLERPERLGLILPEIEALAVLARQHQAEAAAQAGTTEPTDGGAGGGGVILSSPPGSSPR